MKYENTAEIGDTIKAFDFQPMEGRPNRYVIGVVTAKGMVMETHTYMAYTVMCVNDSGSMDQHEYSRVGVEVFVPFEIVFCEYDGRVVKL